MMSISRSLLHLAVATFSTLFFLLLSPVPSLFAASKAAPGSLAILPFKAHAPQDMGYLTSGIRDMLASRLAAEAGVTVVDKRIIDDALAAAGTPGEAVWYAALGQKLTADYIIAGSLTALGNSLSLDAKVYTMSGGGPAQSFFATADSEDTIIRAIDSLAWDIGEKVFGLAPRPAAPQAAAGASPAAAAAGQQPAYQTAHPERVLMGRGQYGASPFIRPDGLTGPMGFTKSQNLKLDLQGMDVGDVDGDGQDEVVLADRTMVSIYKRDANRLVKVGQISVLDRYKIHAVTLADLNGNKKKEICISAADNTQPNSMVVEWKQKDEVDVLIRDASWYLRAMSLPGEGMVLVGQRAAAGKAIAAGIYRLHLNGKELRQGERLDLPESVNLFEFSMADIDGDGAREIIAIDQYDRLAVMRSGGTQLWKSDEYFGGTTRFIGGSGFFNSSSAPDSTDQDARIYVPSRIIVTDINGDGQADVILNKNLSSASRIMKNLKNYPSGEIHALTWNGIGLTELWRTRKIDGYISDYLLQPAAADGKAELLVGVVLGGDVTEMLADRTSTVLMYQIDQTSQGVEEKK